MINEIKWWQRREEENSGEGPVDYYRKLLAARIPREMQSLYRRLSYGRLSVYDRELLSDMRIVW